MSLKRAIAFGPYAGTEWERVAETIARGATAVTLPVLMRELAKRRDATASADQVAAEVAEALLVLRARMPRTRWEPIVVGVRRALAACESKLAEELESAEAPEPGFGVGTKNDT